MKLMLSVVTVLALAVVGVAEADLIAREDFDGGALNLTGSVVPALDGGGGDYFGVGSRNAWPQGFPSPGVPFSIGDDTVFGYSNDGAPFPTDTEGVFGENSDLDNVYFAISDSDEFLADQTATWTFDISGAADLKMSIDFGGVSNDSFDGYALGSFVTFTASIDGGLAQTAFQLDAIDNPGFVSRLMDVGTVSGGGRVLEVSGALGVTKSLAENGAAAGNTYLDKTPPSGPGAGELDTYTTDISGTGSELVLTMTADMPFEALVFDNIVIEGVGAIPTVKKSWGQVKDRFSD